MARDPALSGELFRRSLEVDETRVGERVVLYHTREGGAFVLNPTASLLWDSLSAPCRVDALANVLLSRFPALAPDRATDDVRTCLVELQTNNLIVSD